MQLHATVLRRLLQPGDYNRLIMPSVLAVLPI